jgi:hypothetical protein
VHRVFFVNRMLVNGEQVMVNGKYEWLNRNVGDLVGESRNQQYSPKTEMHIRNSSLILIICCLPNLPIYYCLQIEAQ